MRYPGAVVVSTGFWVPIVVPVVAGSRMDIDCEPVLTKFEVVFTFHVPVTAVQFAGGVVAGVASKPRF
jgi:hypothetical protein